VFPELAEIGRQEYVLAENKNGYSEMLNPSLSVSDRFD
jgi:hypothetical protein